MTKKVYIVYTETEGVSSFEWHSNFDSHIKYYEKEHKEFPDAMISAHSMVADFEEDVTSQIEEFMEKEVW